MQYPQLSLDKQLCHRLYMASNKITRHYRELLLALDLTYPQYVVMMALWENDGVTISKLLQLTAIDGGAMTLILKKMNEKKLLSVVQSEKDKRKRIVKLSEKGRGLSHQAADIPEKMQCAFAHVDTEQMQQLIGLLDSVNRGSE